MGVFLTKSLPEDQQFTEEGMCQGDFRCHLRKQFVQLYYALLEIVASLTRTALSHFIGYGPISASPT